MRRVVRVSTRYTGTKRKSGKWIEPKKYIVNIKNGIPRKHRNFAIYRELMLKKSLRRKKFAWR